MSEQGMTPTEKMIQSGLYEALKGIEPSIEIGDIKVKESVKAVDPVKGALNNFYIASGFSKHIESGVSTYIDLSKCDLSPDTVRALHFYILSDLDAHASYGRNDITAFTFADNVLSNLSWDSLPDRMEAPPTENNFKKELGL